MLLGRFAFQSDDLNSFCGGEMLPSDNDFAFHLIINALDLKGSHCAFYEGRSIL